MGLLDRWRRAEPVPDDAGADPAVELDLPEEVATRPLTAEEEAVLESSRMRFEQYDIDPTDLGTIAAAWDAAVARGNEDEASEVVTVVASAVGDHLVGAGYRWVVSTDSYGTDLAVEPPRRGIPVVVRTLVAVRWMQRRTGWVEGVVGHLVAAGRR